MKFDSSFSERTIASRLSDGVRRKKRPAESEGQLFLVDSSLDVGRNTNIEIKMYRLDEERDKMGFGFWIMGCVSGLMGEINNLIEVKYFKVNLKFSLRIF
ncbi:hypothetical protein HAX54_023687 [Datura stramonium]|uniref:Uncharacterized protein n=1 Tax=Datura stramonium TaxID=4076 RepID=A0ABS8UZ82_DATST|nr:hypothetical protein [Datura stramonium]